MFAGRIAPVSGVEDGSIEDLAADARGHGVRLFVDDELDSLELLAPEEDVVGQELLALAPIDPQAGAQRLG